MRAYRKYKNEREMKKHVYCEKFFYQGVLESNLAVKRFKQKIVIITNEKLEM